MNEQQVRILEEKAKRNTFAASLLSQYKEGKYLSPKQEYWLYKLVEPTPSYPFPNIYSLFLTASSHLKYPKLHIKGISLFWSVKHKSVVIKGFGFIPANTILQATKADEDTIQILNSLEKDPVAFAKMKGIEYSHCIFCGRELTSSISLYHGYGPICAENWGLPWE